ncbi:MAG: hypothetical protein Ct9H300mP15_22660 [Gemmatimonadota bacterium]|nr:MAG: hypothetical protein Ct9H300mP15_22660 [Gemmatimonadota bacterium]
MRLLNNYPSMSRMKLLGATFVTAGSRHLTGEDAVLPGSTILSRIEMHGL